VTASESLLRDYRAAYLRYLSRHEEASLTAGYQLGRAALAAEQSLLDVVRVHHEVLIEVLQQTPAAEVPQVARAASDFLTEVLASYDMARRGNSH
jgi:S-adenosylmethionine:diacylglycerol 3-amino-3-carboxypropyl transferase